MNNIHIYVSNNTGIILPVKTFVNVIFPLFFPIRFFSELCPDLAEYGPGLQVKFTKASGTFLSVPRLPRFVLHNYTVNADKNNTTGFPVVLLG